MLGLLIKKGCTTFKFNKEDENIKYRTLFDRIPHSSKNFNQLYYLLYFLAKILVVTAVVTESALMSKIIMTAFPIAFIIYDILQFKLAKGSNAKLTIWNMISYIFVDLMFTLTIPCVYFIEDSKDKIVDDLFVIEHDHSLTVDLL